MFCSKCDVSQNIMRTCKCVVARTAMKTNKYVVQNVILLETRWKYANELFKMYCCLKHDKIWIFFFKLSCYSKHNENIQMCCSKCVVARNLMKICKGVAARTAMKINKYVVQNVILLETRWKYANELFKICVSQNAIKTCIFFVLIKLLFETRRK